METDSRRSHDLSLRSLSLRGALLLAIVAAITIAAAWHLPETGWAAALGWATSLLLTAVAFRAKRPYLALYLSGVLIHPLAFYWLFHTISWFGGFDLFATTSLFLLFALISGLQYPLALLVTRALPGIVKNLGLGLAIGWAVSEVIAVRIFPWSFGHTQLGFRPFSQIADIGGATLITFVMFWVSDTLLFSRSRDRVRAAQLFSVAIFIASIAYGVIRLGHYSTFATRSLDVALVQANISIEQKRDLRYITTNRERYAALSREILEPGRLIIWPETAVQDFIKTRVGSAMYDNRLPYFGGSGTSFLIGALTFDEDRHLFNSAVAVLQDGHVPAPYHKQILMPFGEYTPLGDILPFLSKINSTAGGFTAGEKVKVFEYPRHDQNGFSVGVSPLICYEDIVPRLAREAVKDGAEVLVNLTNDAWFGKSIAPYQHHLIAAFRAIETRRFLLRSTNTGLTAVVDPRGVTTQTLAPWSEGILKATIYPSDEITTYTLIGDVVWNALSGLAGLILIVRFLLWRRHRRKQKKLTSSSSAHDSRVRQPTNG